VLPRKNECGNNIIKGKANTNSDGKYSLRTIVDRKGQETPRNGRKYIEIYGYKEQLLT
jgi:hypothetical protein